MRCVQQLLLNMVQRLRSPKDRDDEPRRTPDCRRLLHELQTTSVLLKELMIAQETLDASLKGLTAAVDNAVAALAAGSTATSTPDTVVASYQAGVDAQTVRLATATPPPATAPVKA